MHRFLRLSLTVLYRGVVVPFHGGGPNSMGAIRLVVARASTPLTSYNFMQQPLSRAMYGSADHVARLLVTLRQKPDDFPPSAQRTAGAGYMSVRSGSRC